MQNDSILIIKLYSKVRNLENKLRHHAVIGHVLSSKEKKGKLQDLKNQIDFSLLTKVVDEFTKIIPSFSFTIYGSPFPSNLKELGNGPQLYKPVSIFNEIKWILISIRKFSKKLSLFLILKKDFENHFLLGNYDKADNILEIILKELGYSLWYIEAKFLLLEYQNKPEEQKIFLSEIHKQNSRGQISTLSHFLSQRTERNLSAYKYDYDIENLFKLGQSKSENLSKERTRYRLNFFENCYLKDYTYILLFENHNSLIDRYLVLISALRVMFLDDSYKGSIYQTAKYIFKRTSDNSLLPILFGYNPNLDYKSYFEVDYIRILDLYYSGFYEDAILECSKYIQRNTLHFDLLVIYAKCHINIKSPFLNITPDSKSLINQLGLKIYDLISNNYNRKDILYSLYQINKNILSFDISTGLDYFLKKEQKFLGDKKLKLLSNFLFDPYFSTFFKNEEDAIQYLNNGGQYFTNSISINHWKTLIKNEPLERNHVGSEISLIDYAKILFKQKKFEESTIEWQKIILIFPDNAPIVQTSLKYWFDILIVTENYNEAIELYVNQYLSDQNSINKINSFELIQVLRRLKYKGVKRSIDLPIFISLTSNDDLEKSFILEQFCKIYFQKIPSNLFNIDIDNNPDKVELFFYQACSLETLKHSIYINTTIERLTERQKIINYLIELFPSKSKYYQEELNLVSNELIIYEGTQKLEESKIYANDQAIINYELQEIEGLFNRYKTIYNLSLKDKKIYFISEKTYAVFKFDNKDQYKETEVKYSDSALIEVFSELFDLILDKYLFSKFGIVAYLSTRIRHGVLLGEIRPEIDKQNLILSRIGNTSEYERSKYWDNPIYNLRQFQKEKLHKILSNFSLNIDNLIEEIIREKIQIKKDGKNVNGLFNYEFDKPELFSFADQLALETDVKSFSQKVIDLLWERTDKNLSVIRQYMNSEVKTQFLEELNNLDKELGIYIGNNLLPQIFTNVIECSTIIEYKLNKISSWFKRSGSSINDFDIQKVFDIVWVNTERCYPKIDAKCNVNIEFNPIIKSKYYIHFTDLFRIFLDNMFKYGKSQNGERSFDFICENSNNFLVCHFINDRENNSNSLPVDSINGELIINTNKLISENKSGISKALKIVKYDLDNEYNSIAISTPSEDKFYVTICIDIGNLVQDEKDINN